MSRAIRRQQAGADKAAATPKRGPSMKAPRPTRGVRPPTAQKRRLSTPSWFSDIFAELKKVSWPSRDETAYLTMVVIVVSVAVGILLGSVDIFFNWLIDRLLLR